MFDTKIVCSTLAIENSGRRWFLPHGYCISGMARQLVDHCRCSIELSLQFYDWWPDYDARRGNI